MIIENHRLVGDNVSFWADNYGPEIVPEVAIVHYAVTESAGATARVLEGSPYSCHVTIDSTGRVIQQVPFNRAAWHAGKSSYKGRDDCWRFTLGIEVSNPGPLVTGPDGRLRTTYGKVWTAGSVAKLHKHPKAPPLWQNWAEYSQVEVDLVAEICELWRQTYGITDVVGHDDIAPGRKFDPGPAFPMRWLHETIFPEVA